MITKNVIKIEVIYDETEATETGCTANVAESFLIDTNLKSLFVSYKISKFLKERGFSEKTSAWWNYNGEVLFMKDKPHTDNSNLTPAPTHQQVTNWFLKEHKIWITVDFMKRTSLFESGFFVHLRGTGKDLNQDNFITINDSDKGGYKVFSTPEEAFEKAFENILA